MERIRLLLVDDESRVRRGLRMRLALEPDLEVVGEANDGRAAVVMAAELAPTVVLMDVEMPVLDGIGATQEIRRGQPEAVVIVLSMHDDATTVARASEAGAAAFVAKHRIDDELLDAIRTLARKGGTHDE
jgi:DNA-binding NarL/FixJ family response regulator